MFQKEEGDLVIIVPNWQNVKQTTDISLSLSQRQLNLQMTLNAKKK